MMKLTARFAALHVDVMHVQLRTQPVSATLFNQTCTGEIVYG